MWDLVKELPESSEWLSLLAVFVVLPALYCTLAVEVHKEYAELFKSAAGTAGYDERRMSALHEQASQTLHVFEMEWWMIAAVAVLFFAIFNMNYLLKETRLLTIQCPPAAERPAQPRVELKAAAKGIAVPACRNFRSMFALYAAAVGVLLGFRIWWARITAAKALKSLYSTLLIAKS